MNLRRLGVLLAASVVLSGERAGLAQDADCARLRAEVKSAKEALRDCVARGGGCKEQFAAVESSMKNLGSCPEEAPTPTPTPSGDCAKQDQAVLDAKEALRACAAKGGDCAAQMKAVEGAMAAAAACAQPAASTTSPATPPGLAGAPSAAVYLADGSVLHGTITVPDGSLLLTTSLGGLRVPISTVRRVDVGPQGATPAPTSLAPAAVASAPRSPGSPFTTGRFEVGGGFSFDQFSTHYTIESTTGSSDGDAIALSPFVGWFQMDQLEWTATITVRHSFTNFSDNTNRGNDSVGVFVGSTYLFPVSDNFFVGPVGMAGYSTATSRSSDAQNVSSNVSEQGPGLLLGANAKVPIGGSGILTVTLSGYADALDLSLSQGTAHATGTLTDTGLQSTIAFSTMF